MNGLGHKDSCSGPKPTEKEKERLYSDVSANDFEDYEDNLSEGTMVLLQTLEGASSKQTRISKIPFLSSRLLKSKRT